MKILLFNTIWFIMGIVFSVAILPDLIKLIFKRKTAICVMHNFLSSNAISLMKQYQVLGYNTIYYSSEDETKRLEICKILNENGLQGTLYFKNTIKFATLTSRNNIIKTIYGWE